MELELSATRSCSETRRGVPRGGVPAHQGPRALRRPGAGSTATGGAAAPSSAGRRCSCPTTPAAAASAARACSTSCSWPRRWAGWCRPARSRRQRRRRDPRPSRRAPPSSADAIAAPHRRGEPSRRGRSPSPARGWDAVGVDARRHAGRRRLRAQRHQGTGRERRPGRPPARHRADRRRAHAVPRPGRHRRASPSPPLDSLDLVRRFADGRVRRVPVPAAAVVGDVGRRRRRRRAPAPARRSCCSARRPSAPPTAVVRLHPRVRRSTATRSAGRSRRTRRSSTASPT